MTKDRAINGKIGAGRRDSLAAPMVSEPLRLALRRISLSHLRPGRHGRCSVLLLALQMGCTGSGATRRGPEGAGGNSEGGASVEAGGVGSTTDVVSNGPLDTPPPPATNDLPAPSASVQAPDLRVLPLAGFTAAISYTFDDSQPSQVEHWPELEATGARMTFFINPSGSTQQANYDATWTAVAATGSELGNHTWSHCHANLLDCTPVGTAEEEFDQATDYILERLGVDGVYSAASPFGDSGWNSHAASRFLLNRGVFSGMVPPTGAADWYNLPVFAVAEGQTVEDFNTGIDAARSQQQWSIYLFHSLLPTANNWFAGVEISDVTASIAYAQSFSDVWFDTITNVGAYVRAHQLFEQLSPSDGTWTWMLPPHFPPGKVLRVTVDGGVLSQNGSPLAWDSHGYYEVALDQGALSWAAD